MVGLVIPQSGLMTGAGFMPVKKKFEFDDGSALAKETISKLGSLDDIDLFFSQVLVAKYIRDTVGTGLLMAAEDTRKEDLFQGRVGLVLKLGPLAFKEDSAKGREFGGATVKPGQWVLYNMSDGRSIDIKCQDGINVVHAMILEDAYVRGTVKYPDRVW